MTQIIEPIQKNALLSRVDSLTREGYRLVQICCVKEPQGDTPPEHLEMSYSFDIAYELITLRFNISPFKEELPSITGICPGAYLYENELHDLYGIPVKGINVDFKGNFYKVSAPSPFNPACERDAKTE